MICKNPNCQTEIADNALICYRCGRSTTEPRITPPAGGSLFEHRRRSRLPMIVAAVIIVLVLVALAWFFLAGEQQVGRLRFGAPQGAAPIIELGILRESAVACRLWVDTQVHMSWTML